MPSKHQLCLALGSNVGPREEHLTYALEKLPHYGINILAVSRFHETQPVGGPADQEFYLNAAARAETELNPLEVLRIFFLIEKSRGRMRESETRNAARTLDLDLLFYDDWILHEAELTLPHPRLHEREFVLAPLREVAPNWVHPVLKKTVRELSP